MTGLPLVTEIVRDPQRFAELADAWDALASAQDATLALHAWYSAAFAVQQGRRVWLNVIAIWDGDRLVAAAPLMRDGSTWPVRIAPIDAFAGELDQLLHSSPRAFSALLRACAALRQPLLFRRLVASEDTLAQAKSTLQWRAKVFCQPRHASASVRLPETFAKFESSMSTSRSATIRRKWRAAEREHGLIQAEFITPEPRDLPAHLARLEAIEGSGWKGRSGTALAADRRMRAFVARVAGACAESGTLVLAFLRIGGCDAACRLILRQGSTWFEIKIGYDEQFARFSPGVLLMHETLREACRSGIGSYAFLGLREGWQDHWPHMVITDYRLATYPFSASGGFALAADGAQALASFVRRLRR